MAASPAQRATATGTTPDGSSTGSHGPTAQGIARLGKRTKLLVKRLRKGDVAIIDHRDLDRVSGEALVACEVAAVVNCAPSSTGRYPNMGPLLLVEAGIPLVDAPGAPLFDRFRDGDPIELRGGDIYRKGELIAQGELQERSRVLAENEQRRRDIGQALTEFATNTVDYMREEQELLAGKLELPPFRTDFRDRPVVVVVRGVDHQRDLRALRPFIRDMKPVLVGVDGGADAIRDAGFQPDMIVGDMDSASEDSLRCGAELVVHAYPDGRAPGRAELDRLGLPHTAVAAPATSQDIAMLIASERGASLIVSVGSQFNLIEFLDKNRRGMSSTFLTRLRIGEILVDAKGVSRLYRPAPGLLPLLLVVAAGLLTFATIVVLTPGLRDLAELLWLKLEVLLGFE